jgi:hypothetical protein
LFTAVQGPEDEAVEEQFAVVLSKIQPAELYKKASLP